MRKITEFVHYCMSGNDIRGQGVPLDSGVSVFAYNPIYTSRYVHHMVIHGSREEMMDPSMFYDLELLFVWAPGVASFSFPENVGVTFGGKSGYRSICLQIHYNNPSLIKGAVDNSGIRFQYKTTPSRHEIGVLRLGDPFLHLFGNKVGQGVRKHTFECAPDCSASVLINEPVTVLLEGLHMHTSGIAAYNQQFRNGQLIRTGRAEYFDFDQQSNHMVVQSPFQILPGDSFRTTCIYRSEGDSKLIFGKSSSQEMCVAYMFYYPRKQPSDTLSPWFPWTCVYDFPIPSCKANLEQEVLLSDSAVGRTFGQPATRCSSS